jgi:hypothetical protein
VKQSRLTVSATPARVTAHVPSKKQQPVVKIIDFARFLGGFSGQLRGEATGPVGLI